MTEKSDKLQKSAYGRASQKMGIYTVFHKLGLEIPTLFSLFQFRCHFADLNIGFLRPRLTPNWFGIEEMTIFFGYLFWTIQYMQLFH